MPRRSRSDRGKARPLLKIGSEINAIDFLRTISALRYFPPAILVEIYRTWSENLETEKNEAKLYNMSDNKLESPREMPGFS